MSTEGYAIRCICETVSPRSFSDPGTDVEVVLDVPCKEPAIGTTEDGCRVCVGCAEAFRREGFRVDMDIQTEQTR